VGIAPLGKRDEQRDALRQAAASSRLEAGLKLSPAILGDRGLDLQLAVACSVVPGSRSFWHGLMVVHGTLVKSVGG